MRRFRLSILLAILCAPQGLAWAQDASPSPLQRSAEAAGTPLSTLADLQRALTGAWVGTLEYRDYSEPPSSTKRVKLPTWLTINAAGSDLSLHYVYDDGPTKTVQETSTIRIDMAAARYESRDAAGKVEETAAIDGLDKLKNGRGILVLTGPGTENDKPAMVRTTFRIGRNLLEILRETGPPGEPLVFRHAYTFVRAAVPAV